LVATDPIFQIGVGVKGMDLGGGKTLPDLRMDAFAVT
jgi:hypothetical protein